MDFSITFLDDPVMVEHVQHGRYKSAEIKIDTFRELLRISTKIWQPYQYQQQWIKQLEGLLSQSNGKAVLITNYELSSNCISTWCLYREGDDVYIQEIILPQKLGKSQKADGDAIVRSIGDRSHNVSEWHTNVHALEIWLRQLKQNDVWNSLTSQQVKEKRETLNESTNTQCFEKLKQLMRDVGVEYEIEVDDELWFINLNIKAASNIWVWMNRNGPGSELYCTDLNFEGMRREAFYDDSNRLQTNNEILTAVESILRKKVNFYSSPSMLNKYRGYIVITINGKPTRIVQKMNIFKLPVALSSSEYK